MQCLVCYPEDLQTVEIQLMEDVEYISTRKYTMFMLVYMYILLALQLKIAVVYVFTLYLLYDAATHLTNNCNAI